MSIRRTALLLGLLCASCGPPRTPPPSQRYAGFPISGSLADAKRSGFIDCLNYTAVDLRCRRHKVMIAEHGPYEAAVDLAGGDGGGGFDQLTLWDDADQDGVYPVTDVLERSGWQHCMTGTGERGDQLIYTRPGMPVWFAMDLSYWGKRRLRIIPTWNRRGRTCKPETNR